MAVIVGLVLGAGVLWLWLTGHWFGRVLAMLVFAPLLGAVGSLTGASLASGVTPPSSGPPLILAIIGIALAWPVSGIPVYYRRIHATQ